MPSLLKGLPQIKADPADSLARELKRLHLDKVYAELSKVKGTLGESQTKGRSIYTTLENFGLATDNFNRAVKVQLRCCQRDVAGIIYRQKEFLSWYEERWEDVTKMDDRIDKLKEAVDNNFATACFNRDDWNGRFRKWQERIEILCQDRETEVQELLEMLKGLNVDHLKGDLAAQMQPARLKTLLEKLEASNNEDLARKVAKEVNVSTIVESQLKEPLEHLSRVLLGLPVTLEMVIQEAIRKEMGPQAPMPDGII